MSAILTPRPARIARWWCRCSARPLSRLSPRLGAAAAPAPTPHSQTFTYTGNTQYFTVPQRVTSLTLTLDGASGGTGESTRSTPSRGPVDSAAEPSRPCRSTRGQQLRIGVGAAGQDAGAPHGAGSGGYASGLPSNGGSGGYGDGTDMSTGGSGGGGGAATEVD